MEKEIISCNITGDSYVHIKHKSGLDIYVCEMEGFSTTEALFGTKYGSVNTMFKMNGDKDYTVVPEGIAHFLEHKLFENEDCDVFELYAATGASANAYTSFDKTCYLFECSDKYKESLEILLKFVQEPYFTKESVDKEQGIIGQEIKMTNDNPDWRVFFNLLKALYHNHPVKIDIAGTVESIAQIDAELLYKCYNTFYNLHNMILVIAGNVKTDEVLEIADKFLKPCENKGLETVFPDEPDTVALKEIIDSLPVGKPIFNIGFKSKPLSALECKKAEIEADITAKILADNTSPLYKSMMEDGLINSEFCTEVFSGDGYFSVIFGGESNNALEVQSRILAEIEHAKIHGLDKQHFENLKKAAYGNAIMEFNNVNCVAGNMINSHMAGVTMFDGLEILSAMTYEDVQRCLTERFDADKCAISIVNPVK